MNAHGRDLPLTVAGPFFAVIIILVIVPMTFVLLAAFIAGGMEETWRLLQRRPDTRWAKDGHYPRTRGEGQNGGSNG